MRVIDSHTEGEPTRVIVEGGPNLGSGSMAERAERFAECFDDVRRAVVLEPRGSEALVGALLLPPSSADCDAGVIFFNNAGYLGMCGHGSIGLAVTLGYLGRVPLGDLRFETPVGVVSAKLSSANEVTVENVASFCYRRDVRVEVDGLGEVCGDIAWGGNWFFLVGEPPCNIELANAAELSRIALAVRSALSSFGVTGPAGEGIDHVEFFGQPQSPDADSRNFVLCPGGAYDRSPCGTGTSAKLACLAESGALEPGQLWVQESVIGSRFEATYRRTDNGDIIPSITGRAYVCADSTLLYQPGDPFANGIT